MKLHFIILPLRHGPQQTLFPASGALIRKFHIPFRSATSRSISSRSPICSHSKFSFRASPWICASERRLTSKSSPPRRLNEAAVVLGYGAD